MEAKLVVVGGKAQADEYALKLPAIVGRSRSADVPLNHPLVSRQHCELFESGGHLMVRDLGSLNGTFVGDSRVTAEVLLTPGGHLTVGSVTFEAVYEAEPVEGGDDPDFALADHDGDNVDQTVQDPPSLRAAVSTLDAPAEEDAAEEAPAAEAPAEHAPSQHAGDHGSDEGDFDMSWLNDGSEDDTGTAPAAASTDEQTMQVADQSAAKAGRAAKTKEEPPQVAAKPKAEPPARKTAASKAAAAPAPDEVPTDFAPAEEHHASGGDEDMDDFFRSLTAQ